MTMKCCSQLIIWRIKSILNTEVILGFLPFFKNVLTLGLLHVLENDQINSFKYI